VSFDITYTKTGNPRTIRPASTDPLSPLNWEGEMWDAMNHGTFSLTYNDGTFSASGSFDSSGNFGEMGREGNGIFVNHEEDTNGQVEAQGPPLSPSFKPNLMNQTAASASVKQSERVVLLKERVPVKVGQ